MGLAYFMLFLMIIGGAALAYLLLKLAQEQQEIPGRGALAVILLILAGICATWALYVLSIVLRESLWRFRF